jgi:murein DD-endopeptidase MepM/ murein hydrolase activator NlpD
MRRAAVTISFVVVGLAGLASAAPLPPTLTFKWRPEQPVEGSLVAIEATPGDSGVVVGGELAGEPLHFERRGDGFRALGAIPLDAKETARGNVAVRTPGGTSDAPLAIPVRRRAVRPERLRAAERFVRPPDSTLQARLTRERAQVAAVLRATHQRPRFWSESWERPLAGRVLSRFGVPRTFNNVVSSRHRGVDFAGAMGDTVRVANRGVVALVADHYYAGRSVWVDHGAGLLTVYLHLSKAVVATGDTVARGAVVGLVGNSGRVTAPHLHWSALYGGTSVDPMDLLGPAVHELAEAPVTVKQ